MGVDFQSQSKNWLSRYKREVLNVNEDGIWLRNGRAYSHILPQTHRGLNILSAFRDDFWKWFPAQRVQLHIDFHRLNSSQALCFSLFFPFLLPPRGGLTSLVKALDVAGSPVEGSTFEFEPDETEGTNFDFMIPLDTGSRVYFEVKYTETKFGTAKEDNEHFRKFVSVYWSRVANRFQPSFCSASGFLKNYQILRNIWHLDLVSGDTAVFLFPKANDCLAKAEAIIHSCLLEPFRPRVIVMHLEDLIDRIDAFTGSSSERERLGVAEFRLKYFPSALNRESSSARQKEERLRIASSRDCR